MAQLSEKAQSLTSEGQSLASEGHAQLLLKTLGDLYRSQLLTDVTLVTEDQEFKVHMVVLAAYSTCFRGFKQLSPGNDNLKHHLTSSSASTGIVVDFLYSGCLQLTSNSVEAVCAAASELQIPAAAYLCQQYMDLDCSRSAEEDALNFKKDIPPQKCSVLKGRRKSQRKSARLRDADFMTDSRVENTRSQRRKLTKRQRKPELFSKGTKEKGRIKLLKHVMGLEKKRNVYSLRKKAFHWHRLRVTGRRAPPSNGQLKKWICELCSAEHRVSFKFYSQYRRHYLSEHQVWYWCETEHCSARFTDRTVLLSHQRKYQNKAQPRALHGCEHCSRVFLHQRNLVSHCKSHPQTAKSEVLTCKICSKVFRSASSLKSHVRMHEAAQNGRRRRKYSCKVCSKVYQYQASFDRHMQQHERSGTKEHAVTEGERLMPSLRSMMRPPKAQPSEEDPPNKKEYVCHICSKAYRYLASFENHMQQHEEGQEQSADESVQRGESPRKGKYTCPVCHKVYCYATSFETHVQQHRREKGPEPCEAEQACEDIPASISKAKKIKHIMKKHARPPEGKKKRKQTVLYTGNESEEESALQLMGAKHRSLKCDTCGELFKNYNAIRQHVSEEHPMMFLRCRLCDYSFPTVAVLRKHMRVRHNKKVEDRKRVCDICGRSQPHELRLQHHKYRCHKIMPDAELIACHHEGCSYKSPEKELVMAHEMNAHTKVGSFVCDLCGVSLKKETTLAQHKRVVHENIRPYMCDQCGKSFPNTTTLAIHVVTHNEDKAFKCTQCSYETHKSDALAQHMFNIHRICNTTDKTIYKCDQCPYQTLRKGCLKIHAQVHKSTPDVTCPQCPKKFRSKGRLHAHIVYTHSDRAHRCTYCTFSSPLKSKLEEHIRVMHEHPNYKPYKCSYCDFTCKTGGNCRKHIARRHPGLEVKWVRTGAVNPASKGHSRSGDGSSGQDAETLRAADAIQVGVGPQDMGEGGGAVMVHELSAMKPGDGIIESGMVQDGAVMKQDHSVVANSMVAMPSLNLNHPSVASLAADAITQQVAMPTSGEPHANPVALETGWDLTVASSQPIPSTNMYFMNPWKM